MDNSVATAVPGTENEINVKNGNLDMLGMQIKISDIIGDKIVDQFMATMTPEQVNAITRALFNYIFEEGTKNVWDDAEQGYKNIPTIEFRTHEYRKDTWGSSHQEDTPIYRHAKATVIDKYSEIIEEKVKEYLDSPEFKTKAEKIAKEIVDYALEGYKEDIIRGVRERLVLPTLYPQEASKDLKTIIEHEIINHKQTNYVQPYN